MDKLDEQSLRRPDFDGSGFAVELADSQKWTMPAVRIRVFPDDEGEIRYRPWYAGALEDELDILFGVVPASGMQYTEVRLKIAATLLKRNYDLPKGAIGRLLAYIPGEPASEEMLRKVGRAILGRDPDVSDDDDEAEDADPKAGDEGPGETPTPGGSA